jgi:GT2 family glycosyltransferase
MNVAVGVLHYRNWPGIRPTLDAVLAQTRPPEELVVLDHASGDGSAERIREAYPQVDVVEVEQNRGPVAGMKHAMRETLARPVDAIILLTDDARLEASALRHLVQRLEEKPSLGAVAPLTAYTHVDGETKVHYGGYVDERTRQIYFTAESGDPLNWPRREPYATDWLECGGILFRAAAARQTGELDETFYYRNAETDFTMRMKALGWGLECVPSAVLYADIGPGSTYLDTRNELRLMMRHAPRRFLVREVVRVAYLITRDVVNPKRRATRDTSLRLRGLIDFLMGRSGAAPKGWEAAPEESPRVQA